MIEILIPTFVPDTSKARKVLNMTGKDDPEDIEAELKAARERSEKRAEASLQRRMEALRRIRIRRLRDSVKRNKKKWELSVKSLEEALREGA